MNTQQSKADVGTTGGAPRNNSIADCGMRMGFPSPSRELPIIDLRFAKRSAEFLRVTPLRFFLPGPSRSLRTLRLIQERRNRSIAGCGLRNGDSGALIAEGFSDEWGRLLATSKSGVETPHSGTLSRGLKREIGRKQMVDYRTRARSAECSKVTPFGLPGASRSLRSLRLIQERRNSARTPEPGGPSSLFGMWVRIEIADCGNQIFLV
jgi:hypothetical protein